MEWINIKDALPPKDSTVLAWDGEYIDIVYYDGIKTKTLYAGDWNDATITHWMYLPSPPIPYKKECVMCGGPTKFCQMCGTRNR